ncbi:mastermind-like protein 1 [Ambystoma mexicanum]|uniref:mastermind-like protein 1 n=1 Tax=Ambystoma mexicanum TaxID=8296 RepID=UPI0037E6F847
MAEFAVPRHSAVMERLRRRIELCRRHHGSCEGRYESVSAERLELERQQTYSLHQRCLQAKAKRAGKHRAPAADRGGSGGGDSGLGTDAEQSRSNSAVIAQLNETVKRKLDSAASPQNGDQPNGYGDLFSVSKKLRHDDGLGGNSGSSNGMLPVSPLHAIDNKPPTADGLQLNGNHSVGLDGINKKCLVDSNLQLNGSSDVEDAFHILSKELKQEPVDDLPCMLSGAGGSISQNNLMPDLNLNEQEWKELIDELNRSVPDEDMKDLFNEDFGGKKDLETSNLAPQPPLTQDVHIKTEFSPSAFEQEQIGSPQARSTSSGPSFIGPASVPASSASPVLGGPQAIFQPSNQSMTDNPNAPMMQASKQPQNAQRPLPSVMLSGQGTATAKEMSSAHQLQQIAAKQKRDQMLQNQQPVQQVHQSNTMPNWQPSGPSRSPLGVTYSMEKPTSPLVYQQDFNNQKLIMPNMASKNSPRASGSYLQQNHVNILPHQPNALNPNSVAGQNSMLDYGNTKPLTHFKADCGPGNSVQAPNKAAMLAYIQQQQQQRQQAQQVPHMTEEQAQLILMKRKALMACRPMGPHSQDQNPSAAVSRVPVSVQGSGVSTQTPVVSMAGTHTNTVYLNSQQQVVVMKQHQMLLDQQKQQQQLLMEQQKQQFLMGQMQQQLLAEQEKQRHQQEQQLQRHLTRPPPQYQDQSQNSYQQQQVGQFTGSSPAISGVNSLGQSNSSSPRMFSQTQTLVQIGPGHSSVSSVPTGTNQQERGVTQYPSMQSVPRGGMYNMTSGISQMVPTHAAQVTIANGQPQMQRQPTLVQGNTVSTGYGQNPLGNTNMAQQQHSKGALNAALSKPQMARLSTALAAQNPSWQHQTLQTMNSQVQGSNGLGQFNATTGFHLQQNHLKMANQQFSQGMPQVGLGANRPMAAMNSAVSGQMISMGTQQRTNQSGQQPAPPQQVMPNMSQTVPDMTSFSQNSNSQMANRAGLHCGQGYQLRTSNQELTFAYNSQSGSSGLTGDAELIDSLLKNRTSEEWMNDLDELLGTH